jgi:hypothetical protein
VIDEHHILILQGNIDPGRRCRAAQKFIQFGKHVERLDSGYRRIIRGMLDTTSAD